ncbi:TIGR04255 family protein [Hymenobacter sp. HD11105]
MPVTPLPIRITPHALLDTLVEVQYTPRTHAELALGFFHKALHPDFTYERQAMELLETGPFSIDAVFQGSGVMLRIQPGRLVFNCLPDQYLGWPIYLPLIQDVVRRLHATGQIADFPRIGVRYINALPGMVLNEQLQVKLPPLGGLPAPESTRYQVTIADPAGFRVGLTLMDNQRVPGRPDVRSVFDVYVQAETVTADLDTLFQRIDQAHTREKEVFFGLLDEQYLKALSPQYDEPA